MEDKQKIFLDRIVVLISKGTSVDYDKEEFITPFYSINFIIHPYPLHYNNIFSYFSKYVTNSYGLTEQEIIYVWQQYKRFLINMLESEL